MSRPPTQICGQCQSVIGNSDCVHWTGTGATDDPFIPVPNIDDDVDNLVECGPNGVGAFLNPIYVDPPAVHAYGTIDEDEAIPWDTVWPIAFHSTRYDTDNMFDPEDPGHLTINTPGIYLVTFNCRWKKTNDSTVTGDLAAFIRQNEGNYLALDSYPVGGGDSFMKHSISREHPFAAGDTISALVKQDLVTTDAAPENKVNTFITVERMSPIFTAMFLRPIEGMTIVGVDTVDANPGGGSGGIGSQYALNGTQWWETPDHSSLDIVGDVDIRVSFKETDATPAGTGSLVAKWNTTSNQRAYELVATTGAELGGEISTAGSDIHNSLSNNVDLADGVVKAVRWTHAVATGADLMYTKASTPATALDDCESDAGWTLTDTLGGFVGALFSSTAVLSVGARNVEATPAQFVTGEIYAAVVKNGINGTIVANPDFYHNNSPFTDSSGRTWTKNS